MADYAEQLELVRKIAKKSFLMHREQLAMEAVLVRSEFLEAQMRRIESLPRQYHIQAHEAANVAVEIAREALKDIPAKEPHVR